MNRYPNLQELIKYHPYSEITVCDHANIEPGLLHAALEGVAALTSAEIRAIARLYNCPAGVLNHQKVIMLDMNKFKHNKMVCQAGLPYMQLKRMAAQGNAEAEKYLEWADQDNQTLMRAACNNAVSYGCYLGIREHLSQLVSFAKPRPKPRGLTVI